MDSAERLAKRTRWVLNSKFFSGMCRDFPDKAGPGTRRSHMARSLCEAVGGSQKDGFFTFSDRQGTGVVPAGKARDIFLREMSKPTLPGPVARHMAGLGCETIWAGIEKISQKKGMKK